MLAVWMLYAASVGLLMAAGTHLVEARWARQGRARWLWSAALLSCLALPFLRPLLQATSFPWLGASAEDGTPVSLGVPIVTGAFAGDPSALDGLTGPLVWLWLGASLALGGAALWGSYRLGRRRRAWLPATVDGRDVLVSHRTGPAVVGIFAPAIVIPSWILGLPREQRRMILAHEAQHLEGLDALLLAAGLAAAILMPWNAGVWWTFRGLRHAVETDCDHRVLRSGTGRAEAYARLLFDVGTRPSLAVPMGAGFGERTSSLERRIRTMLKRREEGWGGSAVRMGCALALMLAACSVESPDATLPTELDEALVPRAEVAELETTAYTVAPSILNRGEMVAALESEYPPLLRDAGIGGTARIYLFIDEQGRATDRRLDESSGHPAIDDAALRVGARFRFSPAMDGDKPVGVWLSIPITFQAS